MPVAVAFKASDFAVSTAKGPSPSVMDAETVAAPPDPTTTVTVSVAFSPRESVATTRKVMVVFAAGAVNDNVAEFVVAEERTEGAGPDACDHE